MLSSPILLSLQTDDICHWLLFGDYAKIDTNKKSMAIEQNSPAIAPDEK